MLSFLFFLVLCAAWFVVLTKGHAKGLIWKVPVFALVTQFLLGLAWRLVAGLVPFVLAVTMCIVFVGALLALGRAIFKET